jgi:hypothetical protein
MNKTLRACPHFLLEHACPHRKCLRVHTTKVFPDATLSPTDRSEKERKREGERVRKRERE